MTKKLIKKLSSIVSLCDIFHKTDVKVKAASDSPKTISLSIYPKSNIFPEVLLYQACERLENTLGLSINSNVYYQTSLPTSDRIGIV